MEEKYTQLNKKAWNQKAEVHFKSEFYDLDSFLNGKNVVPSLDLQLLGDIKGKSILHLQCHFGMDSLSLGRLGAHVTGVDLSDIAIQKAKELNQALSLDAKFICCDIYELPQHLDQKFDIVYTSYGTIGWLPDLSKWAAIIKQFLKPKGKFVMVDFHPFVWTFNDEMTSIYYDYFNTKPIIETQKGTYADNNAAIETTTHSWNHPISDILNSLIKNHLILKEFNEYDYSNYTCFQNLLERTTNEYVFKHIKQAIPMMYSIVCENK